MRKRCVVYNAYSIALAFLFIDEPYRWQAKWDAQFEERGVARQSAKEGSASGSDCE